MRAARAAAPLALLAALVASGCRVDVEGAPCLAPGAASDCPDGQACGNDFRCSVRALGCVTSRCPQGLVECTDATTARRCDGASDPICGRWVEDGCASRDPSCQVVVDVRLSSPGGLAPYPPGRPVPPECRFARIGEALAAAAARADEAVTVRIEEAADGPAVFDAATVDEWPLVVGTNVKVVAAAGEPPVVRGDPTVATTLVVVRGAVEGLRVEGGGAARTGVEVACGAWSAPSLRAVEVDGEGTVDPAGLVTTGLTAGVAVVGDCGGARLAGVSVRGVNGVALTIDPNEAGTVEVLGGSFGASNHGIWIRSGKVTVKPEPETVASVAVSGNAIHGIVIGGRPSWGMPSRGALIESTLERIVVAANGGTGIAIATMMGASRLQVRTCDVGRNGAIQERRAKYNVAARDAGGVLVANAAINNFTFAGNRLWANGGDQLAFDTDWGAWSIAAQECGPASNLFACVPYPTTCGSGGPCAIAVTGGGAVNAGSNVWPAYPGDAYMMYGVSGAETSCPLATATALPKPVCP